MGNPEENQRLPTGLGSCLQEGESHVGIPRWLTASGKGTWDLLQTVNDWLWCSPSRLTQRLLGASQSWKGWLGWGAGKDRRNPTCSPKSPACPP